MDNERTLEERIARLEKVGGVGASLSELDNLEAEKKSYEQAIAELQPELKTKREAYRKLDREIDEVTERVKREARSDKPAAMFGSDDRPINWYPVIMKQKKRDEAYEEFDKVERLEDAYQRNIKEIDNKLYVIKYRMGHRNNNNINQKGKGENEWEVSKD